MTNEYKRYIIIAILAVPAVVIMSVGIVNLDNNSNEPQTVKAKTLSVLDEGMDFSNSTFQAEDHPILEERLNEQRRRVESAAVVKWQTLANIASIYKDVKDYDHAFEIYNLLDEKNPEEKSYQIERAQIHMRQGRTEKAISELQRLKQDFPIPEVFTFLADAYKQLDGTPNYVVDDIYKEGIYRHNGQADIVYAYIDWLEETGREEKTIEYYERLAENQPELQTKVDELKAKYE